jgi:hypothetical protein
MLCEQVPLEPLAALADQLLQGAEMLAILVVAGLPLRVADLVDKDV